MSYTTTYECSFMKCLTEPKYVIGIENKLQY